MILPSPDPPFAWRHLPAGAALVCEPLERLAPHFFTTRQWTLRVDGRNRQGGLEGQGRQDDEDGWSQLAREIGVPANRLRRMKQIHGREVAIAATAGATPTADILLTDADNLAIAVQTADCVPLLFADERRGALAVAHAGWRGLAARVPVVAVEAMVRTFGSRPGDLLVAVGPSIGSCCYEVGADVREAFAAAGCSGATLARYFAAAPSVSERNPPLPGRLLVPHPDHWFFDGWTVVRDQLAEAGVNGSRVLFSGLCTGSHPGAFCSYRRDGAPAGRMAGAIRRGRGL